MGYNSQVIISPYEGWWPNANLFSIFQKKLPNFMQNSHICGEFNRKLSSIIVSKFKGLSTLTKMTTIKNPENPSRKTLNPPGANPYPQKTHFPKIQLTFPSICNLITSRGIDDHNQPRRDPFCNLITLRHVFNLAMVICSREYHRS